MLSRRHFLAASALVAPGIASAQTGWPSKPIRWIVNFPPAGAADILSRSLADYFGTKLGQPIVVENKPGAGGIVGADIVAKAKGDTHMVTMSNAASHGIGPVLYKDVPYDALKDFIHIHLVGTFPTVLAINGTSPITSVKQLVEMAKAEPGKVTYGSGGNGTMNHLTGQLLARATGMSFTHVPYRGSAPAMNDLMGGQIVALMESLPTFREAGFADVVTTNWFGCSTPTGLPPELPKRWEAEIGTALKSDQLKAAFDKIGVRPGTLGSEAYTALIKGELVRWKEVITAANIKAD